METAEEGGATATTNSSYGGGAGGKFRKKPSRRQTTPYARPVTALRPNNSNSSSSVGWLTKLVVDQASKLISYGSNRVFGSILRKSLPAPPLPPQAPDANHDVGEEFLESVPNEELTIARSSQPVDSSNSNGISDLEKLLKRNTFTRSEILHLTELLHSRAVEASRADESEKMETHFGRYDENRNEGVRSHGTTTSTPIFNSRVHEEDIGSPAELAMAYMGSRPSKVSPSMLGTNRQVSREDTGLLLNNIPFISNSPIPPLMRKSSVSTGAAENGFITPRSCGRSALYNMARTPYSRVHPTSIIKGGGNKNNDFGSSMPASPLFISEHGEKIESKSMSLKRRSSYLDDEVGSGSGSVGPVRRIRQKQNLLVPRAPHSARGVGIGSAKQKLPLIEANHGRNKNGSVASISYASVPSRSSEVASKILQHLEKLSPKEQSPGSKLAAVQDKSSFKLNNKEDKSNANLPDARESTSQNLEKVGETGRKESVAPLDLWSSANKNDESVMLLKVGTSDTLVRNDASQPPQKKRAFRMNGQEDGDVQYNGSLSEKKGPIEESNLSTAEDLKSMKTTVQPEVKSTSGFVFSKTSEFVAPASEKAGEGNNGIALPASEEASKASQLVTAFDKPKGNPPSLFSFSSHAGNKFPPLPSESSSKMPEPKLDGPSSLFNNSAPNGFHSKTPESEKADLNKIGKLDTAAASNGLFGTSTSTTSSALAPATITTSAIPVFKSGSSADPSPLVSAPSTTQISQVTDTKTKPVENQSFVGPNSIVSPFSSSNSGNSIFGLTSTPNNLQGSSAQPISSTSFFPSFTTNSSNPFGSSVSSSHPFNSNSVTPVSGASYAAASDNNAVTSNTNSSPGIFSFGLSSSSPSTNAIGFSAAATSSPFIFGGSSPSPASAANTFSTGAYGISSSAPMNSITSSTAPSNVFGSSTFNSSNTGPSISSSPSPASSSPIFAFGAASASALSTPPIFGNTTSGFGASPGNNAEDSMAEDPVQSSTAVFGQPPGFMFGQAAPVQANPFQFGGQTSQVTPNPFQASSSLEFNAGGSGGFSLGSGGGGDKSARRSIKVSKTRNRKKRSN